ncbi:MAG: hypothetical protein JO250_11095, partial [Armatimonadetes bacterium]|nr:hypothetical protein [Armatimonadota bacterium]
VVFTNPHDSSTRIYFAADIGKELLAQGGSSTPTLFDHDPDYGRVWAVNQDGSVAVTGSNPWVYPQANDPNDSTKDNVVEPSEPLGDFLNVTPAIGLVEYPAAILQGDGNAWQHTDHGGAGGAARTITFDGTAAAQYQQIAMLYVGTNSGGFEASGLPTFYEIDVDGQDDTERSIYGLASPNGGAFQSSPALVVNGSTAGGNGGSVFLSADNSLLQFQATPTSNPNTGEAFPQLRVDVTIAGAGPISSPAVSAADVQNLPGNNLASGGAVDSVRDWVYIGDNSLGLCRGFTPNQTSLGGTIGYSLPVPPVPSQVAASTVNPNLSLRSFIFDGSASHPASSRDMTQANPMGGTSPPAVFEWGQDCYIRIGNVVPPGTVTSTTDANNAGATFAANGHEVLVDPTDPTVAYGDGGIITVNLSDVTPVGRGGRQQGQPRQDTLTIPNTAYPAATTIDFSDAGQGIYKRSDAGTPAELAAPQTLLLDTTGHGWVAAASYHVAYANGVNYNNTPGARRRIINVQQPVQVYRLIGGSFTPASGAPSTLGATTGGVGAGNVAVDQPTFAILNPLAVRGGGIPLSGTDPAQVVGGYTNGTFSDGIGPFRAVDPTLPPVYDLQAASNGNRVYTNVIPPSGSGVANGTNNPTRPVQGLRAQAANYPQANIRVITTTPQIAHNTQGDNTDPNPPSAAPPSGAFSNGGNGIAAGSGFGPATLDIADRSLLGSHLDSSGNPVYTLQVSVVSRNLGWNDNTGNGSNGPGAAINPLPWETAPIVGSNQSLDYPDILAQNLTQSIAALPTTSSINASPPGANVTYPTRATLPSVTGVNFTQPTTYQGRAVNPDSVRVQVSVPKFQPANLQLWDNSSRAGITPTPTNVGNPANLFPMGYQATEMVAATSGGRNFNPNARPIQFPYRNVQVFTGVPVDLSTSISNQVTDVGVVPHGFGIQTENYSNPNVPSGLFAPTNPTYQPYFRPLTIYNTGNTNLINPHLDQKLLYLQPNTSPSVSALPLLSDALDTSRFDQLSFIPGFDFNGVRTGPRTGLGGAELPDLVRSSLDTDLAEAFGVNPSVRANGQASLYPVVTFHKPRVSDGSNPDFPGTPMTVPDVPHDNIKGNPYYLYGTSDQPIIVNNQMEAIDRDPTSPTYNQYVPASGKPAVSVAVPLGTPVGTYSQTLRLFEGYDVVDGSGNITYNPLVGPLYGGLPGGIWTSSPAPFNPTTANQLDPTALDTFKLALNASGVPQALQAYSDPGTQVKVTVQEDRLTDNFTPGALPQIDLNPQGAGNRGAADFLPAAFRDPNTGNLSLYWTTSRDYAAGNGAPPYRIAAANLGFNGQSGNSFFAPAGNNLWWSPIASVKPSLPAGSNVGWSVAPDQPYYFNGSPNSSDGTVYAFDINVVGSGAASTTNLYAYPVAPDTGAVGSPVLVTSSPQPKSGVRGLKFSGVSFNDVTTGNSGSTVQGNAIGSNLWAFWTGGTRGRTALYYSPANTSGGSLRFGTDTSGTGSAGQPAVLPVPAGLVSVSDPAPVLAFAPDSTLSNLGNAIPAIEVTYGGISASGNADVYVSRYRPYHPRQANGQPNNAVTLLALLPFRQLTEQLQPFQSSGWWQARDVGWLRNGILNVSVTVGGNPTASLLLDLSRPLNPDGTRPLLPGVQFTYDRASGLLVFTGVKLPGAGGTTIGGQTVYVDPAGGRVRFSLPLPAGVTVTAVFNATARRITTDPLADTEPTAFLDQTFQPNSSGIGPHVQADRYWFVWHKPAVMDATPPIGPALWYKTQRLTVALLDANGLPMPILVQGGKPQVDVSLGGTLLYDRNSGGVVDVDATRGRLYFPIVNSGRALEGWIVTINGTSTEVDAGGNPIPLPATAVVHWIDEPRYNDSSNQIAANDIAPGAQEAAVSDGYAVPIRTIRNESAATAFLDPLAYLNGQAAGATLYPHNIWLFWTSTRAGTSDIFYETINPRFSPVIPSSGAP